MIDALVAGKLLGQPAERTARNGSRYATCKVRASMRGDESVFVNCIAFSTTAVDVLLALSDGDSIALSGELTVKVYTAKDGTPKPSLDLLAHVVLTPYHVSRKRAAAGKKSTTASSDGEPFNDEIQF
jgi:single-stranded DNA-binding protein